MWSEAQYEVKKIKKLCFWPFSTTYISNQENYSLNYSEHYIEIYMLILDIHTILAASI